MLHTQDRWIQFQNLKISSEPEHAPPILLSELAPYLIQLTQSGDAIQMRNNEKASIRVADARIEKDGGVLLLLLQYADMEATDPVFCNLTTGELRTETKLDGEGIAVSAHVVINLIPDESTGVYSFLLEEIPGLARSSVQPFIRKLLKEVSADKYIFADEIEGGARKAYRPVAEVLATPSESFIDDLASGTVEGIELVKFVRDGESEFDEDGFYKEQQRIIKVGVLNKRGVISQLPGLRDLARQRGFDNVKVRYKKTQGKRKTAVLNTTTEDLNDSLVVRTEQITSEIELPQCSEEIISSFTDKMIALMDLS